MRRARPIALATALAALLAAPGGGAFVPTRNLSGVYAGTAGNTIELTHRGTSIRWVATSGSGDWVHDLAGTLEGEVIDGAFEDRPGHPVRNDGRITAKVLNNCAFRITSVQVGTNAPDDGGEVFERTGACRKFDPRPVVTAFTFEGYLDDGVTAIRTRGSGRVRADSRGRVVEEDDARGTIRVVLRDDDGDRALLVLRLQGPGTFQRGRRLRLVAEVLEARPTALARTCLTDPIGVATFVLEADALVLTVCDDSFRARAEMVFGS